MLQKIKDLVKDWKTYVGMLVSAFGAANAYLHFFMPLAPDLRLRASVFVFLIPSIAVGITILRALARKNAGLDCRKWAGWVAGISTALGVISWAAYDPIASYFQSHSGSPAISQWFDGLQIVAYSVPFLCWGVAVAALVATLF